MPIAASPPPLPACTAAQAEQNQQYCNHEPFNEAVCTYDNGLYCPARCGVCRELFAEPATSTTVQWTTKIATEVHLFDRTAYRNKLGSALGISRNRISLAVTAGSIDVQSTIVTIGGTPDEANVLTQTITATFTSPEVASALLDVSVASFDIPTTVSVSPSLPPFPPQPPSPEFPPLPSTPPGVTREPPPSAPVDPGLSTATIAGIVLVSIAVIGALSAVLATQLGAFASDASTPSTPVEGRRIASSQHSAYAPVLNPTANAAKDGMRLSTQPATGISFRLG
jgi:hypothetical protein